MRVLYQSHDEDHWARLTVDDEVVYEGHGIPHFIWLDVLRERFGCEVIDEEHDQDWWDEN